MVAVHLAVGFQRSLSSLSFVFVFLDSAHGNSEFRYHILQVQYFFTRVSVSSAALCFSSIAFACFLIMIISCSSLPLRSSLCLTGRSSLIHDSSLPFSRVSCKRNELFCTLHVLNQNGRLKWRKYILDFSCALNIMNLRNGQNKPLESKSCKMVNLWFIQNISRIKNKSFEMK